MLATTEFMTQTLRGGPMACRHRSTGRPRIAIAWMMALLLTMMTVPWFEPTPARAESISTYVSGRGNDGNSCTISQPCKTLQRTLALTTPGGQINALDSADYGYVTINKAVSIVSAKGSTGVLAPSSVSGVTINAGATDVINLQGLEIDGAGSGANGIQFVSGAALNVKDSVIRGFNNGINFQPTGASTLSLSHTLISNNSTGVTFQSSTAGSNVLDNVQIIGNGTGISVAGTNSATPVNVTIQNSVVANNPLVGILAGNYSNVTVTNSTLANNGVGLQAQSVSAHLQVSGSSLSGNTTGWVNANGGQIVSSSGNVVGGNTNGDTALPSSAPTLAAAPHASTPTPTMAGKDPILFAKNIVTDFGAKCDGVADDNAAFTAFNTWAQSQTGTIMLTIPSGSICMFTGPSMGNWFAKGIKSLIVTGYGATLSDNNGTGNGFFLGGRAVVADNMHSSRLETVLAGATTVTLKAQSEIARFQVGNWALITGLDMMGYGYPPNPAIFEYVQITAIDPSTGIVTFASPLKNTYKSTWPLYNAGIAFEADQGGPATLYALDPSWNTQVEYRGLTLSQAGQTYANGRSVTFRDVTFTGGACGVPSQSMLWQVINTNMSNCGMEVDKLTDTLVISGVTIRSIHFQSASVNSFNMDGSTVTYLNGTPIKTAISNSTIANFMPGAYAYGVSKETTCTNCVLNAISIGGFVEKDINAYNMTNGVLTIPNSHGPVTWAIPGANIAWSARYIFEGPVFQVTDVTQDASNTYVHTTLTGGFPTLSSAQATSSVGVRTLPAPKFTCNNCTGSADAIDLSGAPAGAPLWSYSRRTYSGSTPSVVVPVWGQLTSLKLNPTTAYAGSSSINFNTDSPFVGTMNIASVSIWNPMINPKVVGERTMLPATVSGAQTGDSISAPGNGSWLYNDQITPKFSTIPADIGTTSVTVTIQTDQGVVNQ